MEQTKSILKSIAFGSIVAFTIAVWCCASPAARAQTTDDDKPKNVKVNEVPGNDPKLLPDDEISTPAVQDKLKLQKDASLTPPTPKPKKKKGVQSESQRIKVKDGSCEDQTLKMMNEHVLKDKGNVLAKMFELSNLRLASRAARDGAVTLEGGLRKEQSDLEARIAKMESSAEIMAKVKGIYEAYGLPSDLDSIRADLNAVVSKGKTAQYWACNQRLKNDSISAFVLSITLVEGENKSGLSEIDAATIWVVEKLRRAAGPKYQYGTELGNLMSSSTRAARYLGYIQNGDKLTHEQTLQEIETLENDVARSFTSAADTVQDSLKACVHARNGNCPDCDQRDLQKFGSSFKLVSDLQKELLKSLSKANNGKMVKDLKGSLGEITFDFSNFRTGKVPETNRAKPNPCTEPDPRSVKTVTSPRAKAWPARKAQWASVHPGQKIPDQDPVATFSKADLETYVQSDLHCLSPAGKNEPPLVDCWVSHTWDKVQFTTPNECKMFCRSSHK